MKKATLKWHEILPHDVYNMAVDRHNRICAQSSVSKQDLEEALFRTASSAYHQGWKAGHERAIDLIQDAPEQAWRLHQIAIVVDSD